jgi:hypothetical protein
MVDEAVIMLTLIDNDAVDLLISEARTVSDTNLANGRTNAYEANGFGGQDKTGLRLHPFL